MAGTGAVYAVENHPQKAQILKRIMDGHSLRAVAEGLVPPVSVMALHRYKTNIVKPILARAEKTERIILSEPEIKQRLAPPSGSPLAIQSATQAIQDAPILSVFRSRLEKLHGRIDRSLDKAEEAVRVVIDEEGEMRAVGKDLGVLAPLLTVAHKNLEILGRATGELEPQGSGSVSIQIVTPNSPGERPRVSFASPDVLDGTAEEIGLLQKGD